MLRRDMLRRSASTVTALSVLAGTATARNSGELPSENVQRTYVHPWGPKSNPIDVDAGDWITHMIGWIDKEGGDRTKEDVIRAKEAIEFFAFIDGEEIENAEQYFTPVQYYDRHNTWGYWWYYHTPPKTPGRHSLRIKQIFPDGFKDGDYELEPGFVWEKTGYYEVNPGERGR